MSVPCRTNTCAAAELLVSEFSSKQITVDSTDRLFQKRQCPCQSYVIDRALPNGSFGANRWIQLHLSLTFNDTPRPGAIPEVVAELTVPESDKFRLNVWRARLELMDRMVPKSYVKTFVLTGADKTSFLVTEPLSSRVAVKFSFGDCKMTLHEPSKALVFGPNTTQMVTELNPMSVLYDELQRRPEAFGVETGRFSLSSEEGDEVYPHCNIMQQHSVEMKRFFDGNLDGIRDGVPLCLPCSSAALKSLLQIIYLQKIDDQLIENLLDVLEVAHLWQMTRIVKLCLEQMSHMVQNEVVKDFDRLRRWFVAAAKFEDANFTLEWEILSHMIRLAGKDAEKEEIVEAQVAEYVKDKSPEEISELMMSLNGLK